MKKGFLIGLFVAVAALVAAFPASAQSLVGVPAVDALGLERPQSWGQQADPTANRGAVDCTSGQFIFHDFATAALNNHNAQTLGQSFTAPCDGVLVEVDIVHQQATLYTTGTFSGTFFVYAGAGTGGTVLASQAFNEPVLPPAVADFWVVPLATPVAVTMGSVYTFFTDVDVQGTAVHAQSPGTYAGGDLFASFTGDPATATGGFGFDMRFAAVFDPPAAGSDLVVTCVFTGSSVGGGSDIPPGGGRYFYDFSVTNNGASPATVDIWMDVDGPGTDLTFGPYTTRTVNPGATLSHSYKKGVPGPAPGGTYTHTCHVGTFDVSEASDSFTWTKDPPLATIGSILDGETWNTDDGLVADGGQSASAVAATPDTYLVEATYPNPFNPEATFRFTVATEQTVRADLVNVLGQVVATLYQGNAAAGEMQTVRIDGASLPSGTYVVRLVGETFSQTQRVTLLK